MPPRGVKSAKRARQYEHIKESAREEGRSPRRAKQIAAATVNKQRRQAGETKGSRKRTSGSRAAHGFRLTASASRKPQAVSRTPQAGLRKPHMIFSPSADDASSAPRTAVMLRSSRIGFTSTRSSARSRPESATISISVCASR